MNPTMLAATPWAEYLDLASHDDGGRLLVRRLLDALREPLGVEGTALYLAVEGCFERELVAGSGAFPPRLGSGEAPELERVALPGAELVYPGGASGDRQQVVPLELVLASAVRAYVLEKRLKRQRFEVNYRGVELEALYDVGLAIASTLNLDELAEEVLLRAVSLLDARRGALYLVGDGSGYVLQRTFGGDARARVDFGEPAIERLLAREELGEQDVMPGAEHLMAASIKVDGKTRGLLLMADKENRHGVGPFQSSDRRTLELFANQAAIAIENAYLHRQALEKERLEREAELAADIQRRLLPSRLPEIEGLEVAGWSRPARHVGGDYYDLLELPGGNLAALVADVAGKGIPAALMVSTLYSALRLLVDRNEIGPDLLRRLNRHICESSAPNKFITLLVAEVDGATGEVSYMNAGHNPALLVRASGEVRELESGGMPLGVFASASFRGGSIGMESGDLLCLFSDGITEAATPEEEEFGPQRLADLLREVCRRPLAEIVETIEAETSLFAQGQPQADDQTLVLIRRL